MRHVTTPTPVLSYRSEAWTIRRTDDRRLISAEMRFLRRTAGYTHWDHKRNKDILTELQMSQITEFIYLFHLLALQSCVDLCLLDDPPPDIPIQCFLPPCLYFQ
jgi:hypothetical protein